MSADTFIRFVADSLSRFPRIKRFVRSGFFSVSRVFVRGATAQPHNLLTVKYMVGENGHCFFGYFDKCPWSKSEQILLFHRSQFANRMPKAGDIVEICSFNTSTETIHVIGESRAWNFQQGSMLQWLESDSDRSVVYNDFQKGQWIGVVRDLISGVTRTVPRPVHAVGKDGVSALSLNPARLSLATHAYGYAGNNAIATTPCPADDGIWHVHVRTGQERLIVNIRDIVSLSPRHSYEGAYHYLNHLSFNPSCSRIAFLHRWMDVRGNEYTTLFTSNCDGTDIYALADYGMTSHYCWESDCSILAWARHERFGLHYYRFTDRSDELEIIGNGILNEDGHPSVSTDARHILTDTYPDRRGNRRLVLYDRGFNRRTDLAHIRDSLRFQGPLRCDLHPRFSRFQRQVCVDAFVRGVRRILVFDLGALCDH